VSVWDGSTVLAQFDATGRASVAVASSRSVRSSRARGPFAEERTEALLVAAPLGEELLAPLALEVAPLADEHRRDVELLRDDAQVRAQREPDLLGARQRVVDPSSAVVKAAAPSRATSQSRSAFESMWA
jgi:hypothetical protein